MENVKFSREDMHEELRNALYQTVRCLSVISSENIALRMFDIGETSKRGNGMHWLMDPDSEPNDFEFHPKDWEIVKTMDRLYDYAIHGVARVPIHQMADETEYTFAAAYVHDLMGMNLIREINAGDSIGLARSYHVAQLGAARVALDGGERFFHFDRPTPSTGLTIREIALLAGMEESSVRNASIKGKSGALKTYQEDGNTLVSCDDALEWLKGRKGFVPTTLRQDLGEVDLRTHSFATLYEVDDFIDVRFKTLGVSADKVAKQLKIGPKVAKGFHGLYFTEGGAQDQISLGRLAKLLEVQADLFALRVQEASNQDEARKIRKALAELAAAREVK